MSEVVSVADREHSPSGWRWTAIGQLAEEVSERAGRQQDLPVLSVTKHQGIVRADDYFKKAVHGRDTSNYKVVRRGQFAYATIHLDEGSIGVLSRESAGIVSPMYTVFRTHAGVDAAYLLAVLKLPTTLGVYKRIAEGTVNRRASIGFERLRTLRLLLPPLGEQRKIAAILSSVDDAIEATQAVIDQLQVVKNAMMSELLTRGLPGRHTRFKMTKIGEVPEEWEVVALGEVCERMFVGIAQAATHAYVTSGGVPIIRTTNVRPNLLRVDDILRINDKFAEEMRSKRLREGDVLSARTGNPGTSVVVPAEFDGAQCFTLLVSRPGPRLLARFLCHLMNSAIGGRIVQEGQAGGAQQNLNVGVFEKAIVGLPPVEEQGSIAAKIDAAYERERSEEVYLFALRALKSSLMSVLLSGEVRVTPDEEAA